jgi:hypothetical protein
MAVVSSFLGDNKNERVSFVANNVDFYRRMGKKVFLLADEDSLGILKSARVLAPGYVEDSPIDVALEALVASGSADTGAVLLSRILVPEEEIRSAREPFWERSARMCLESLIKTAARAEASLRKNTQPPYTSLSSRINKILCEITQKKFTGSSGPLWWEKFATDNAIETMIHDNAKNTALGILSVMSSHVEVMCRISSSERVSPMEKDDSPVAIYAPAYDVDELNLLLSVLSMRFPSAILAAAEADALKEIISKVKLDVVCASVRPVAESDVVTFGRSALSLPYFREKALETTGFERLTFLPYETPDALPPGLAISLFNGKWQMAEVPTKVITPVKLSLSKEESEDEVIADLLCATPKEAKVQEFEPEEYLNENDWVILDDLLIDD